MLRLRVGDEVTVSDGMGRWRTCRFGPVLQPVDEVHGSMPPRPAITVAFAVTKGQRPEWTVQKLTELGVDAIVPFLAARSVVRWEGDRADKAVARLRRVAREAAMQSRRLWLPELSDVEDFASLAARPGAVMTDEQGGPPSLERPVVLVGPEGGWDGPERRCGLPVVSLGPAVLRAETAAVAAAALWCGLRSGVVRSACDDGHRA